MENIKKNKDVDKQLFDDFNSFLSQNRSFIQQITPINPTLSADDEWRTIDYFEYDMED